MLLANPGYLWLFLLFIPLIAWYVYKQRTLNASMEVSTVASFAKAPRSIRASLRHLLFILQLAAIGCVIIVLARPQTRDYGTLQVSRVRTSCLPWISQPVCLPATSSLTALRLQRRWHQNS